MTKDEKYISRCLQLAYNGLCNTAPNPMVGAVIVYHDTIIGEGYHIRCGEAHAEVNAIRSVKDENLLKESTIYVSLEPCSHYGKTPPCADLIIEKRIPKVVIGCIDPYSQVAGKGIEKLRKAGMFKNRRRLRRGMPAPDKTLHNIQHAQTPIHNLKVGRIR